MKKILFTFFLCTSAVVFSQTIPRDTMKVETVASDSTMLNKIPETSIVETLKKPMHLQKLL